MIKLPEFKLETHFSEWEFKARYHMTASDAESITLPELLSLASPQEREQFEQMSLGYSETWGAPDLRQTIASIYHSREASEVLCFAGAGEGIFVSNMVLLDEQSHAIVVTPNYQAHESLPGAICEVTGIPLDPDNDWSLDLDRLADAIRPNTRLLTINFPHNPTGKILPLDDYKALVELCRKYGIYILHDEIFNGLGPSTAQHLPWITDIYERGLSLNVMSKAYGLPGLRIGWIACADRELLSRMERFKHYTSICNSAPSERLTNIALNHREELLARTCAIVDENLPKWDAFFARYPDLFDWYRPDGSCTAYPRYKGADGVEAFCQSLVEKSGVLFLPCTVYRSALGETPSDRFRLGYGRRGLDEGLDVLEAHIASRYC